MTYIPSAKTQVPVGRSRDELERILTRVGADGVAFMRSSEGAQIAFRLDSRNYVMRLPAPSVKNPEQAERVAWRHLLLLVKAKVIAIQTGITSAEAEFLAHAMLPTGRTLGEHLSEHPEELATSGRLMLPGGPS